MLVAKQFADLLTCARLLLGCGLVWLGISRGKEGLEVAVWAMILDWTGDILDGPLARRSQRKYPSWWGDHDLEIDMAVSVGLLVYLLVSGWINIWLVLGYLFYWAVIFWYIGIPRSLGMLFQAPIYALFIFLAYVQNPIVARWLVVWLVGVVVITWPRFPQVVIPQFLTGLRKIKIREKDNSKTG